MIALLVLYQWTILAGCTAGPTLALLGGHLATRDRAMQTLCIGQGAMVGVLLALGFIADPDGSPLGAVVPFLSALAVSSLTFYVTERLVENRVASRNTSFALVFAVLLAAGYLIGSLFPALESHMAQIYFGDLATLTVSDSKIAVAASLLSLAVLVYFRRPLANQSFEAAIFGDALASRRNEQAMRRFKLLTLVVLCFSVQFLGFLFTVAMLFLPTGLLSLLRKKGFTLHAMLCCAIAAVSAAIGFLLSLSNTRLPTVPSIVAVMVGLALAVLTFERVAGRVRRREQAPVPLVTPPVLAHE